MSSAPPRRSMGLHQVAGETYPRYNVKSTLVPCPDTHYVFLFGGFDENDNLDSNVYLFNMKTRLWEVDSSHSGLFREGHLALYLGNGNVFVFGGVPDDAVPSLEPSDELKLRKDLLMLMYLIHDRTWISAPEMFLANAPSGRSRHACCLSEDGRTIYLSGGLVESAPLADLYSYDLRSGTWLGPVEFVARFDHKLAVHDGKLYSFGGLDGDMNHVTNKITYMNLADQSVVDLHMKDGPKKKSNNTLLVAGEDLFGGPLDIPNYTILQPEKQPEDESVLPATYEKIWLDCGDPTAKLEVSLPQWGCGLQLRGISVVLTSLATYSRTPLLMQKDLEQYFRRSAAFSLGSPSMMQTYQWRHAFVLGKHLYLIGHCQTDPDFAHGSLLSTIFEADLVDLGVKTDPLESTHMLADDYQKAFVSGEYYDYEILAFKDQDTRDKFAGEDAEVDPGLLNNANFVTENLVPIPVHKTILLARWPHFRRVIDSGMTETHSGQLFVPEACGPVRALLYYLYTGTIDTSGEFCPVLSTVEYSVLLILSNLYELQSLRSHVLSVLFKLLSSDQFSPLEVSNPERTSHAIDSMLRIWQNALILNEEMFMGKIEEIIHMNWLLVSRSLLFMNLSKVLIVKLCQDCFDAKTPSQTPATSKRDSLDLNESSSLSPALKIRDHSNSPFTKTFDDNSTLPDQAGLGRNVPSSFPHLQNLPNRFSDFGA